jgi:hypothetical protein
VPSFNFVATDNGGLDSNVATETITVTPVNDGNPLAVNDSFKTLVGTPITFTVAQLLANDNLLDHANILTTSVLPSGLTYNGVTQTYTYNPAVTGSSSFTYTIADDDGQTSTATVNLQAFNSRDDLITVQESALPEGNGTGVSVVSGNLFANDAGLSGNITALTNAGGTASLAGNIYTLATVTGTLVVNRATGDYTYTLNNNVDNDAGAPSGVTVSGIDAVQTFTYTRTGGTANLTVTIQDDVPTATNATVLVSEGSLPTFNIVMMLDVSGSMTSANAGGEVRDEDVAGNAAIATRLEMAKQGMVALVEEYFSQSSNVSITLATFSSGASIDGTYTSKDAAIAAINALNGSGGTNYEAALNTIQTAFGTPNPANSNIVYFISDGAPSVGNTTNPVGASGYDTFLASNPSVLSFSLGIGSGISNTTALNGIHNVDGNKDGVTDTAILVADLNNLESALLATIPKGFGGNLVTAGGQSNVTFGADGGFIRYIDIMLDSNNDNTPDTPVRFTYNAVTNQITEDAAFLTTGFPVSGDILTLGTAQGFTYGSLVFNFNTGDYTYFTGGAAPEGTQFNIGFQVMDNDGDTATAVQTIQVVDGKPIANNDFDTLLPGQTFFEGNVINAIGTDGTENALVTNFTTTQSGADFIIDNAAITSVVFKGVTYNLTTNSSGSASGGSYTIVNGTLTWTSSTEPANKLVFENDGYYKYTPPAAQTVGAAPSAAVTTFFNTSGNASANGVLLSGVTRTGNVNAPDGTVTFNNPNGTNNDGAGINGGGSNSRVDNLETLIIEFNRATHSQGVQNVVINVASGSNLGDNGAGTITSLTYSIFDISGNLLGQFASFAEGNITIPTTYGNIGRIEIEANSAAQAIISSVTFQHSNVNNTAVAIAPEEIQYTLTDSDGDTSSATLRLTVESNHYAGTSSGDTLTGSNANDYMSGLDGDDNISGGAGADVISGGAGNDTLDGGADNDQIFGGAGNDTIVGGTGNDLLYGEAGNDNIQGGDGNDLLSGGVGSDTLNGGAGADTIIGGAGADVLTGGLGVDVFKWELGDQGAKGTPTNDIITDFNVAPSGSGGDVLDLRDLLTGEAHIGNNPGNLASYLHFEKLGADTIVHVSANGEFAAGFNPAKDVQTITLSGVDLVTGFGNDQQVIQDLLTNNKLIVD